MAMERYARVACDVCVSLSIVVNGDEDDAEGGANGPPRTSVTASGTVLFARMYIRRQVGCARIEQ